VRFAPAAIEVLVTEGVVRLTRELAGAAAASPSASTLLAGQRAVVPTAQQAAVAIAAVSPEEVSQVLSWRAMRFELSNTPLAEAIDLFNRRSRVKLALADESLAGLRVSGLYWADNPEGFARLIEASLDVKAIREGDRIVIRRP
jgi:transmembrane sensor